MTLRFCDWLLLLPGDGVEPERLVASLEYVVEVLGVLAARKGWAPRAICSLYFLSLNCYLLVWLFNHSFLFHKPLTLTFHFSQNIYYFYKIWHFIFYTMNWPLVLAGRTKFKRIGGEFVWKYCFQFQYCFQFHKLCSCEFLTQFKIIWRRKKSVSKHSYKNLYLFSSFWGPMLSLDNITDKSWFHNWFQILILSILKDH